MWGVGTVIKISPWQQSLTLSSLEPYTTTWREGANNILDQGHEQINQQGTNNKAHLIYIYIYI